MLKAFVNSCIWMVSFCLENSFQLLGWGWSHLRSLRGARFWLGLSSGGKSLGLLLFRSLMCRAHFFSGANYLLKCSPFMDHPCQTSVTVFRELEGHLVFLLTFPELLYRPEEKREHWLLLTFTHARHWGKKMKIWRSLVPAFKELQR